jgi:hypothetical protein
MKHRHPTLIPTQASTACSRAPARTAVAAGRRDRDADAPVLREAAVPGLQQARARQVDRAVGRPGSAARAGLRTEQAQAAQRQLLPARRAPRLWHTRRCAAAVLRDSMKRVHAEQAQAALRRYIRPTREARRFAHLRERTGSTRGERPECSQTCPPPSRRSTTHLLTLCGQPAVGPPSRCSNMQASANKPEQAALGWLEADGAVAQQLEGRGARQARVARLHVDVRAAQQQRRCHGRAWRGRAGAAGCGRPRLVPQPAVLQGVPAAPRVSSHERSWGSWAT